MPGNESEVTTEARKAPCERAELVALYALQALPADDLPAMRAHLTLCPRCRRDLETLLPTVDTFASWPTDLLRPAASLWNRLTHRIAEEAGEAPAPRAESSWREPAWENVAPGISCKLLATDALRERVSMLVRLAPDAEYPPHRHAGIEELYLLGGELWIDGRKLHPGDYNRAVTDTIDKRVWSETGCTCVLITSMRDTLL